MSTNDKRAPVVIGITGASGATLAAETIELLLANHVPVVATASPAGRMVWRQEMAESFGAALERWTGSGDFTFHAIGDLTAPIASGTYPVTGMAIVPCSMGTAAAVAQGLSDNLLRRAADVALKERSPLVLVPRETPLSVIHLENLAKLARAGAAVIPPMPAFYLDQKSTTDVVDYIAHRVLLALGIVDELPERMRYTPPEA